MAWEKIDDRYEPKPGELLRIGVQIKAPFSTFLAGRIRDAIRTGYALRNLNPFEDLNDKVEVRNVYWTMPSVSSRTGRSETWWIYVEALKRTANPIPVVIYGLIALIITASTAVLIAGKSFERFAANVVEPVGETVGKAIKTVFNPGVILAVFILGFMFLRGRG